MLNAISMLRQVYPIQYGFIFGFGAAINSYPPIHVVPSIKQLAGKKFWGKWKNNKNIQNN